ncbi:MAG: hypothetical protein ACHQF2_08265 [Flavobacteriales bacterium]
MFEHKKHRVIPRRAYVKRQLRFFVYGSLIIILSLFLGVAGYMISANLSFADALLNACMILTGMGPVNPMPTEGAKYFASFYALYSGIAFLTTTSIILAPAIHRFFHLIQIEESN